MFSIQGIQQFVANMLDIIVESLEKSIRDEQNISRSWNNLTMDMFTNSETNFSDDESYDFEHEDQEHFYLTVIPMTIVYSVLFFTGVVGNICTCIVIYRNRYMHTATNYYLFSLAISDLLLLVMSLPQEVYELWVPQPYPLGETMCVIRGFTAETSTYASILTITAFTAERYIAICHPLKSHAWSSLSRAVKIIMVVWTVSAFCAVPVSFQFGLLYLRTQSGEDVEGTAICALKRRMRHAFLISSLLFFWIPQLILFFLYVKIGLRLRLPNPLGKAVVDDKDGYVVQGNSHKTSKDKRRISINSNRKGIIKMLVAVVVSFFICWSPFHAQRLMADYVPATPTPLFDMAYTVIRHISGVTYYLSPTVNPILYQLMSLKFQQAFKDTFGPFSKCLRGEGQMTEMAPVTTNVPTECSRMSTRIRRSPCGSPQTTAFNI